MIWSSHPLSLASTPTQVYIDGIPQLSLPGRYVAKGPTTPPRTPNFDFEKVATVVHEGIPPLEPRSVKGALFVNVSGLYMRGKGSSGVMRVSEQAGSVGVEDGRVVCVGRCSDFAEGVVDIVDLEGGTIIPGLTSFGAPLGLVEIRLEPSTNDRRVYNPLDGDLPAVLGDTIMRAQDGLMFGGQNLLYVHFHALSIHPELTFWIADLPIAAASQRPSLHPLGPSCRVYLLHSHLELRMLE